METITIMVGDQEFEGTVQPGGWTFQDVSKPGSNSGKRGRSRITFPGFNHPNGMPIRFKSTAAAARHIRNIKKIYH